MNIFSKLFKKNDFIPKDPGAHPERIDNRDKIYEEGMAFKSVEGSDVDWNTGFELDPIKVEGQNGSGSCVGQAWAKYLEVLERKENNNFIDLSAKFIYSQIYLPDGGAFIRDGAKIAQKQGCSLETSLLSYPATEEHMRASGDITGAIRDEAKTYKSKEYRSIQHKNNMDIVALAIKQNSGVVTGVHGSHKGWGGAWVTPPSISDKIWGHAIYLVGYGIKEGKKYIKFINSWSEAWGDKGYGYLCEDYFTNGNIFALWTLVDLPNEDTNDMLSIIGDKSSGKQYVEGKDSKLHWIFNEIVLESFHEAGIVDKDVVQWKDNIQGHEISEPWAVVKSKTIN